MNLMTPKCPQCGEPAIGASDFTPCCAFFDGDPTEGEVDYEGESEMYWDGQFNAIELAESDSLQLPLLQGIPRDRQLQVQCEEGHEWITEIR